MKKLFLIITILCAGCKSSKLPNEKLSQFEFPVPKLNVVDNSLEIYLQNPVKCPLRIWLNVPDKELQNKLDQVNPIVITAYSDTLINIPHVKFVKEFSYKYRLGSVSKEIQSTKLELPFPKNKSYFIIQGNNTNYTHNTNWSKYALDFSLKINDTICAATSGYVVGVIDKYKYGGADKKWRPFGNFITIYDPDAGIFTQYVHLVENGSLVKLGVEVKSGQPIALSGKTGQTNIEHLHFNCLVPINDNIDGLKSVPVEFIEGYKSIDLKKNDIVKK